MLIRFVLAALLLLAAPVLGLAAETSNLAFVTEYVRELGANEQLRALAGKDVTEPGSDSNAAIIRSSTRIILELNAEIAVLKGMKLDEHFASVPEAIAAFYEKKIDVYQQMIKLATTFLSGPKPNVDYGAEVTEAPKLTAAMQYIDHSLFQATPLIFATLIADKPDSQGHMSRLRITRAERDHLLQSLQLAFGNKMEAAEQNYIVGSATVLRDYLSKKEYKCADDPL